MMIEPNANQGKTTPRCVTDSAGQAGLADHRGMRVARLESRFGLCRRKIDLCDRRKKE
jgi:hypothetical protein